MQFIRQEEPRACDRLGDLIEAYDFHFTSEQQLQAGIEELFTSLDIPFEREWRLDRHNRIDFLVQGPVVVGVECKIAGQASDLTRQIQRYAKFLQVQELVVVTTKVRHREVPYALPDTPVRVVWLSNQSL